jgi:L-alanine-DL-glutamate epimerase-like enolase superfamily enzyme
MSRISRVEVQEFEFELPDLGFDSGGFNIVFQPANRLKLSKYAIAIEADDAARGEYVTLWGGSKMALGQTLALAPHLLGRDPHQRELIYDDFKRALRQYDHMGVGCIDIALWDLAGKQLGVPIWKMLGGWRKRLPTYASSYHGDRNGGLSSAKAYVDFAEQCYEMGYRAFKMHGWCDGNAKEECEAVLELGRNFHGRMNLMLDPACELRTFADALAVGRACDEAGFFWY